MRLRLPGRVLRLLAPITGAALLGCGGGGGHGDTVVTPPPVTNPTFACSDSPVQRNQVALKCGAFVVSSNTWVIDAMIGGPTDSTDSTDIDGFAFDVLFDPAHLAYVDGSVRAGALFFQGGMPPLVTARLENPGRLVVGIHMTGSGTGVQAKPGYNQIITFSMKPIAGAVFDLEMLHFENHQALDSTDQPIPSITFSDQILLSNQ